MSTSTLIGVSLRRRHGLFQSIRRALRENRLALAELLGYLDSRGAK